MKQVYEGYQYCWNHSNQCLVVRLEDLCFSAVNTIRKIDNFIGKEYFPEQFFLKNKRYGHTKGNSINVSVAVEHLASLPTSLVSDIAAQFKEFDRWFYDFS